MLLRTEFLSSCICCFLSIAFVGLASNATLSAESYTETPGTEGNGNFVIGPDYTIDPDLTDRGSPKGVRSAQSQEKAVVLRFEC